MIIYYDGDCALCHSIVHFILRIDRNSVFRFAPLSHLKKENQHNFPDSLVLENNGEYYFEGKAILGILKRLSWQWRFLGSFLNLFPLAILDQTYRLIANNRKRWTLKNKRVWPIIPAELRNRIQIIQS